METSTISQFKCNPNPYVGLVWHQGCDALLKARRHDRGLAKDTIHQQIPTLRLIFLLQEMKRMAEIALPDTVINFTPVCSRMGASAPSPKPPSAFQSPPGGSSGGFGPNSSGFGGGHGGNGGIFGGGGSLGYGNGAAGAHSCPRTSSPLKRTSGGQQKLSSTKTSHQGQDQGFSFDNLGENTKLVMAGLFAESLRLSTRNAERQR
jgi:hypothetical protein